MVTVNERASATRVAFPDFEGVPTKIPIKQEQIPVTTIVINRIQAGTQRLIHVFGSSILDISTPPKLVRQDNDLELTCGKYQLVIKLNEFETTQTNKIDTTV